MARREGIGGVASLAGPGCIGLLLIAAAMAFAIDRAMAAQLPPETRPWVPAAAAVFITLGLSSAWHLLRHPSRPSSAPPRAVGEAPAGDGVASANGRIVATETPLRAPLSGRECVAYMYRMSYETGTSMKRRRRQPVYWGQACQPFAIATGLATLRVLAMPQIVDTGSARDTPDDVARARAHVAATTFEPIEPGVIATLSTVFETVDSQLVDNDGRGRRDWALAGEVPDLATLTLKEEIVPVGANAWLTGHWSALDQAFIATVDESGPRPVTISTAGLAALERAPGAAPPPSALSAAITAVVLILVGCAVLWVATILPRSG